MNSRGAMLAAVLVTLSACGSALSADGSLEAAARKRIAAELADPSTATFRGVHASRNAASLQIGVVCGEVAGAGIVGFHRFLYGRDSGLAQIEHSDAETRHEPNFNDDLNRNIDLFNMTWTDACT